MSTSFAVRSVRWLLIAGLVSLVPAPAADVDSLVRVLRDPDKTVEAKGDACLQLMDLGPAAAPAVSALVSLLNVQEEMLRDYAVTTLDRIGPAARNALPALRRTATKDTSPEIRELARTAITRISGTAPAAEAANPPSAAPAEAEPARPPASAARESPVARAEAPAAAQEPPAAVSETSDVSPPPATRRPVSADTRPTLEVHQGKFFRWAVPIGWNASESASGVTLTAPDGLMQVSSALIVDSLGRTTPADFTVWLLGQLPGNRSLQVVAKRDMPDQPSGSATPWKVQELEMRYAVNGIPVRAIWTTGIVNKDRSCDAYILGYQSIPLAFERARLWLASVARSVVLTNPAQATGNDRMRVPSNHPLDHPALLETWREKGLSEERILQAQRDGMMGYETVKDRPTGRIFEMPLEAWDSSAGGYHNPARPDEILQRANAGE